MRKLFTIDDFVIALVSAVGYGFSFEISKIFGCPEWLSIVSCLVVGTTLEGLAYKIVFSEPVQTKPPRRFTVWALLRFFDWRAYCRDGGRVTAQLC